MRNRLKVPAGYRAVWGEREKLCVAKLAGRLRGVTSHDEFQTILLESGATAESDWYVEAHIWGSVSVRTVERVILKQGAESRTRSAQKALRFKLEAVGLRLGKT